VCPVGRKLRAKQPVALSWYQLTSLPTVRSAGRNPCNGQAWHGKVFYPMAKNIYVGNLAWGVTNEDLLELFGQHGTVVRAQVITDRETGRSRGFAFVEMESDQDAQKAIEALNNVAHNGRPLTVNVAKEREERGPRTGGGGGGGYGGPRGGGARSNFGGSDRGRRY
jgi:RNA recognition motif-containing protein